MNKCEKEFKYLIDKQTLELLDNEMSNNYQFHSEVKQTNYYFDTENLLFYKNGITLRIRFIENKFYKFTMKISRKDEHTIFISDEYSDIIGTLEFEDMIKLKCLNKRIINIIKYRIPFNIENTNVQFIGTLDTNRKSYLIPDINAKVSLDKNKYLDVVDYELECEVNEVFYGYKFINKLFRQLNIKPKDSINSKYRRFIIASNNDDMIYLNDEFS